MPLLTWHVGDFSAPLGGDRFYLESLNRGRKAAERSKPVVDVDWCRVYAKVREIRLCPFNFQ